MFTGTTIEELINSVCRAEERVRQQQRQAAAIPAIWEQQPPGFPTRAGVARGGVEQRELVEVA